MQEWNAYVKEMAERYKVDPYLARALAVGESAYGKEEVRFCWVGRGKYLAPYNLHFGVVKRYNVTDWKSCTEVGIILLAVKLERSHGNIHSALRTYNTGDKGKKFDDYVNNIKRLQQRFKDKKIFEDPIYNGRCQMTKN